MSNYTFWANDKVISVPAGGEAAHFLQKIADIGGCERIYSKGGDSTQVYEFGSAWGGFPFRFFRFLQNLEYPQMLASRPRFVFLPCFDCIILHKSCPAFRQKHLSFNAQSFDFELNQQEYTAHFYTSYEDLHEALNVSASFFLYLKVLNPCQFF